MSCTVSHFGSMRERRPSIFRNGWEIAAMVVGFVVFWPIGLVLLFLYIRRARTGLAPRWLDHLGRLSLPDWPSRHPNSAFEDHRAGVLRRLDEERRKLDEEARAFEGFLAELKQARDREEFDAFLRKRAGQAAEQSAA